jgi:hypothetical protein
MFLDVSFSIRNCRTQVTVGCVSNVHTYQSREWSAKRMFLLLVWIKLSSLSSDITFVCSRYANETQVAEMQETNY